MVGPRHGMTIGYARLAAEAIVAVVFTVGAEVLELPAAGRKPLAERIIQKVRIILGGAQVLEKNQRFIEAFK